MSRPIEQIYIDIYTMLYINELGWKSMRQTYVPVPLLITHNRHPCSAIIIISITINNMAIDGTKVK